MSVQWKDLTDETQAALAEALDVASQADALLEAAAAAPASDHVTIRDLHAFLWNPNTDRDGRIQRALRDNARARETLDILLQESGAVTFPEIAAAYTDTIVERDYQDGRATLRLFNDPAVPDQTYLVLDIEPELGFEPQALFVFGAEPPFLFIHLPEAVDGTIQTVVDADDPLVAGLGSLDAKVKLR